MRPDLDLDPQQLRGHLPGRELEGDRPARVLADKTQFGGQVQVVDLDHHAIGFVGKLVTAFVPGKGVGNGGFDILKSLRHIRDREAERP